MRKLLFILLFPVLSYGQQLGEISRIWERKDINVFDGMAYRYFLGQDTAHYFHAPQFDNGIPHRVAVLIIFTDLDAVVQPPAPEFDTVRVSEIVDDQDLRMIKSGAITGGFQSAATIAAEGQRFYMNSLTYRSSLTAVGSITFEFDGDYFEWRGERNANRSGLININVDGTDYPLNIQIPPNGDQEIFLALTLVQGHHVLKLSSVGNSQFVSDAVYISGYTLVPR